MLAVMTLGVLRCQEGIRGLKPAQACCSSQNSFASCSVLILYIGLSQVYTPPMLIWLTQIDIHTLLMNSGRKMYTTTWSTQLLTAVYLKQRPPSSCPCVEISWASFTTAVVTSYMLFWASWAHHPCLSSLSLLPLKGFIGRPQKSPRLQSRQWFHPWSGQMNSYIKHSC